MAGNILEVNNKLKMKKMIRNNKANKVAEIMKKQWIRSECFCQFISNMKTKYEDASSVLIEYFDIAKDTEKIKLAHIKHHNNLLALKKAKRQIKTTSTIPRIR